MKAPKRSASHLHLLGRKVGFRYLMAKKSSSFLSVITLISVGGVAVGVLTMVVTLSVMAGFESELKKRLFSADTHVLVENAQGGFLKSDSKILETIQKNSKNVRSVYPVLQTEVILKADKKVTGAVVRGIAEAQKAWLDKQVEEWAPKELLDPALKSGAAPLFVGSEMAFEMALYPGALLSAVSPVETEGPLGAIPRVKRFVVEGIYKTGIPEQELHVAFTAIKDVEAFLRQKDVLSQIEIKVGSLEDAPAAAQEIAAAIGSSFLVRPWQELNSHLFESLKLERTAMFVMLIFIIIVASFNIVSTLTMMVLEKKRSLSILRAMGATPKQVAAIFVWEGLAIGLTGVSLGLAGGVGICVLLAKFPLIQLPEYYYDRTLPVLIQSTSIASVVGSALVVVLLGAVLPARKASQLTPLQGIKEL